jgi:7-carboxy-7-deazaguanine synthase
LNYKLHNLSAEDEHFVTNGEKLPVMEEFYTIQGEGFNTGKAAYFIRIGGCDIGCHWCDVKESWNANLHPLVKTKSVIDHVIEQKADSVVITGGEPLIYNLDFLTGELKKQNVRTFIETSGAYAFSGVWDWICLSPKKTMLPLQENYKLANELKVIVYNKHDLSWAQELAQHVSMDCILFLQPEWSKSEELIPLIVEFVKTHTKWRISLQSHKYMHIP